MKDKQRVLVVDDEAFSRRFLQTILHDSGCEADAAETAAALWDHLARRGAPDLILLDVRLPDENGLDVLKKLRAEGLDAPVIIITAYGSISEAVTAMKLGAFDFLGKPFEDPNKVRVSIRNALAHGRLLDENRRLKSQLRHRELRDRIIGESKALHDVLELVAKAARVNSNLLLEGESGTGKEVFAEAAHRLSDRHAGPFIPINCAALPESLLESALFGYEKGAFTGALKTTPGFFEEARGGILFLDEIGEAPLSVQAKILRAVEQNVVYRVGGAKPIATDARLIFATNKDLGREAAAGRFRRDLYFRVNIIKIVLPPLRDRRGDIPLLVNHFLDLYCRNAGIEKKNLDSPAVDYLLRQDWPGNVRELKNFIERLVALHPDVQVGVADLKRYDQQSWEPEEPGLFQGPFEEARRGFETAYFRRLLDRVDDDLHLAAEESGLHLATIYRKLKALGLRP
ncbi:MAG: sigma-54 dependent transcriptional regulator [Pseudomonadota bacterium]